MKLAKSQLKQIIKEELDVVLKQEGIFDKFKSTVGLGSRFDFWWLNKNPTIEKGYEQHYEEEVFKVKRYLESNSGHPYPSIVFYLPHNPSYIGRPGTGIPPDFWSEKASAIIKDPAQTVKKYIIEIPSGKDFLGNRSPFVDKGFADTWSQTPGHSKKDVWVAGDIRKINTKAFRGGSGPRPGHPFGIMPTHVYSQLHKALSLYQGNTVDFERVHLALGAVLNGTAPEEIMFAIKSLGKKVRNERGLHSDMLQLLTLTRIAYRATSVMMDSKKRNAIIQFFERRY